MLPVSVDCCVLSRNFAGVPSGIPSAPSPPHGTPVTPPVSCLPAALVSSSLALAVGDPVGLSPCPLAPPPAVSPARVASCSASRQSTERQSLPFSSLQSSLSQAPSSLPRALSARPFCVQALASGSLACRADKCSFPRVLWP